MNDVIKLCMSKKYIQSSKQTNGLNVTGYEKFIDMVSDSILQPLRNYHSLNFHVVLKKNIRNYLKALVKYY